MAIEQLGESLLSEKRKRDEDQARKLRRREERNALLGLAGTVGIGLYRSNLQKKQQDFFNSKPIMDMRLQEQKAKSANARTDQYTSLITSSGKNDSNYFLDEGIRLAKERALIDFADDEEMVAQIKAGRHDANFRTKAQTYRDRALQSYRDGLKFQQEYNVSGNLEEALKTYNKNPKSAAEAFFGSVFKKRDFEQETLQALEQSRIGGLLNSEEGSRLSKLQQSYQQLGSLSAAFSLEDMETLDPDIETKYDVKLVKGADDVTRAVTIESKINRGTGKQEGVSTTGLLELNDPKALNRAAARKYNNDFNPLREARVSLTATKYAEFVDTLRNQFVTDEDRNNAPEGTDPTLIRAPLLIDSIQKYNAAVDLWSAMVSDANNLKQPLERDTLNAGQITWRSSKKAIELLDRYNILIDNDQEEEANKIMVQYVTELGQVGAAYDDS
jgi:hypothetical protein